MYIILFMREMNMDDCNVVKTDFNEISELDELDIKRGIV